MWHGSLQKWRPRESCLFLGLGLRKNDSHVAMDWTKGCDWMVVGWGETQQGLSARFFLASLWTFLPPKDEAGPSGRRVFKGEERMWPLWVTWLALRGPSFYDSFWKGEFWFLWLTSGEKDKRGTGGQGTVTDNLPLRSSDLLEFKVLSMPRNHT
jgi:hypothetical protein